MNGGKRFFISNSAHPCTEIALDANRIRLFYLANGWQETVTPGEADDIIVSTCAVNQQYEDAAMQDLQQRQSQRKPGSRLISTGCLSRINPQRISPLPNLLEVPPLELERFNELVPGNHRMQDVDGHAVRLDDYQANPLFARLVRIRGKLEQLGDQFGIRLVPHWMATIPSRNWYFIRGSTGCLGHCTYCAVRRAKGRLRSTPLEVILQQLRQAVAAGAREISLAGDDMGAWGTDIGSNLAELLSHMISVPGDFRINLRFVEPVFFLRFLDALLPVFATGRVSAFCLPLQSGSNHVLERMGRDYRIEEVEAGLARFATVANRPRLASIIMVGFPGETESDYFASCRLLDRLPIDLYQVLMYEGRPGTPSIAMSNQIPTAVKQERHDRLLRKFKLQKVVGIPASLANRLAGLSLS
ncbi:MAG TPA: radical SAM protein [Candidatus Ozemobacteraceae bacterium]|nr:radical SAM protein [Candidatus Ozemobacteraceae bacterium]